MRASFVGRLGFLILFLAALPLFGQVVPRHSDLLLSKVVAPAGFVATVAPEPLGTQADPLTAADANAFRAASGGNWKFYVDRRSGGIALAEGHGVSWIPSGSSASVDELAQKAIALVNAYPNLFQVPASQLALDRRGSLNFGEQNQYWNIAFKQTINHVPVDGARVVFRVSRGNLVQFGVDRTIPGRANLMGITPSLSVAQARSALGLYLGGLLNTDLITENGALLWAPRGAADAVGYTGAVGQGWTPTLAYRFTFSRANSLGTWQALVDARTGAVLRFVDVNEYADPPVTAKASVYTLTNCANPSDCVSGNQDETAVTLPFLHLQFVGADCTGEGCFTNSAGAYTYPNGAQSATSILDGKYFQVVDTCGAAAPLALRPDGIDFGTSDKLPTGTNTDCAPGSRQSAPGTLPLFAGTGNTHSARNTYYHLNLINEKGRAYLPANDWMQGVNGTAGATIVLTDLPPACNAFWNGITLNFMRVTPGLFCNNTGEIPDVFLHEWGHGLDQNDATGTAPESATGEAMGDSFALLQGQHSCIGLGFRLKDPSDPSWGNTAGYGNGSRRCSGVRDLDYTNFCWLPDRTVSLPVNAGPHPEGCRVLALDPDAPNGSRAGVTAPAEPAGEIGTPARWNNMLVNNAVADGQSNFWSCGGPETTGCAGPLNHGCHCESQIVSQSNWDLAKKLIKTQFGGDVYGLQGPKEISGWQTMDRLWYLTRDIAVSGYSVLGNGTTNGCGVSNWYSTYRFIDDDNGDLADGTPHAGVIFSAFDLHATACGVASDTSNLSTGCNTPPAPVLAVCDNKTPVTLQWSASSGATQYRILRNTVGANFGYTPLATVPASQLAFSDEDVAPGVSYFYAVQPVGASSSCYGLTSNTVSVVPQACPANSSLAPPATITLSNSGLNQVRVSWTASSGAASYLVYRKNESCDVAGAYTQIGIVAGSQLNFVDTANLQGGHSYSYQVAAASTSCATCPSARSACESIAATGNCFLPPTFAGVRSVTTSTGGICKLTVNWSPGVSSCGTGVTYSVYRSTDPLFAPSTSNRVAFGLSATSYSDYNVDNGARYYYIVRATDGAGNTESNLVRHNEVASGQLRLGTYVDDGGDSLPSTMFQATPTHNDWSLRANGTGNATRHWATTATGNYKDSSCMSLESPTLTLTDSSTLSFRSRYLLEPGWDGGFVEVATEGSGFSNWSKLTSITYPGHMASEDDPGCGPGFADGEPVFTGTSADQWLSFSGSLSAYANQRIRVRFTFASDGSNPVDVYEGWFIDDIQVSAVLIPNGCEGAPAAAPSSLSPNAGPTGGGTSVTIAGTAFEEGATVLFGGVPAASVSRTSSTQLIAVTPAGPTSGFVDVTVSNPTGRSGTLAGAFHYVDAPSLSSLSPSSGPDAGRQLVEISGTNLVEVVEVKFGGAQAAIVGGNAGSVVVRTPAHAAGTVDVVVTTAGGSATLNTAYTFVVAPTITSLSVSHGLVDGGEQVIVYGTDLSNASSVKFGGTAATILSNDSDSVTIRTPAHNGGIVDVSVTTPGGTAVAAGAFRYQNF
jgi:fibronectin type 3 domain-containing protein